MVGLENGNVDEEGIVVRAFPADVPEDVSLACVDNVEVDDVENKGVDGLAFDTGALDDSIGEALGRVLVAVVGPDDVAEAKLEGVLVVNVNGTDGLNDVDDDDENKDDLIRPGELAPIVSLGLEVTLGAVELDSASRSSTDGCGGTGFCWALELVPRSGTVDK
ncbi:hypothetical protein BGZ74_004945 [Mortierella antarctica]|nr:hypothetical protein BGZ74_004945 [Mortierella antarctica]